MPEGQRGDRMEQSIVFDEYEYAEQELLIKRGRTYQGKVED